MLTKLILDLEELAQLNYERYHYPCPIVQKRLQSIYIKASMHLSNKAVCQITGAHPNSLGKWITIYRQEGFDGLCKIKCHRSESLFEGQSTSIIELFTNNHPEVLKKQG